MTRIRGARSASDLAAASRLIAGAFDLLPGMGSGYAGVYRELMASDPTLEGGCSRLAEVAGEIAGHALVVPRAMEVGGICVPAGIVAFVAVREDLRGRGIGTALLEDAGSCLRARGALVSHLSGVPEYYRRFGYVEVARRSLARIRPERLAVRTGGLRVREASSADAETLTALFLEENLGRTGCIRRDPAQWVWQLRTGFPLGYAACNGGLVGFRATRALCLVAEGGDRPLGYLRLLSGPQRILVHEAVVRDDLTACALFARARELATEIGARRVECSIPPEGRAGRWLSERGAELAEGMDPEALVKALDHRALAARLAPGMYRRLGRSPLRGMSVRLEFATEREGLILEADPTGIRVADPGEAADWRVGVPEIGLTQMIFGARDYARVIQGRPGVDPDLEAWISVLFPEGRPWIHLADML